MNARRLIQGSLRTLTRYKLRTFFMSLGVAVGVATLVAGRSFGDGAEQQIIERVNRMFGPGTILIITPQFFNGSLYQGVETLKIEDLEAIAGAMDQVVDWAPRFSLGMMDVGYQGTRRQVPVDGHSEAGGRVWNRAAAEGRYITREDLSRNARVAVIGPKLAESLFARADPIDEEIQIDGSPFRVVGVLESIGIDPHGEDRDEDIVVPITTAMRRMANADYVGAAKLVVEDMQAVDEDAEQVRQILRERHRIAEGETDDFKVFTSRYAGRAVTQANQALRLYLLVAAGVVLLVATVVIASIMLAAVRERIAEIGMRKAVGATERSIGFQFLLETVGVTLVAGLLGIALAAIAIEVIAALYELPLALTPESATLGLSAAVVVGVLSGLLPARRAARLNPVDALR